MPTGINPNLLSSDIEARFREKIRASGLSMVEDLLVVTASESMMMFTDDSLDTSKIGTSRAFGRPDLPDASHWPKSRADNLFKCFMLQLDLSEIPRIASCPPLPATGLLSLFADDYGEAGDFTWLYFPVGTDLQRIESNEVPEDRIDWYLLNFDTTYPTSRIVFRSGICFDRYFDERDDFTLPAEHPNFWEQCRDALVNSLRGDLLPEYSDTNFLGYAYGEPYELGGTSRCWFPGEMQMQRQGIDTSAMKRIKFRDYEETHPAECAKWLRFLTIKSVTCYDKGFCWMWNDLGTLYFGVHEDDLRNRDFARIHFSMECG